MFLKFLKNIKFTIILVLVVLVVVGYGGYRWYEGRMFWVNNGMASPKFPFRQYTLLEVVRQGKVADFNDEDRARFQQELKNLPTRTTPEETFDMYIQALRGGDIERALECCVEKTSHYDAKTGQYSLRVREYDGEKLYKIKEEGRLEEMIKKLEEIKQKIVWDKKEISKGSTGEWEVSYVYKCDIWEGEREACSISFLKNTYGDWELIDLRRLIFEVL